MIRLLIVFFSSSLRVFLCKSKHKMNRDGTAGCSDVSSGGKNVVLMRAGSPEDQKSSSIGTNREFSPPPAMQTGDHLSWEGLGQPRDKVVRTNLGHLQSPPGQGQSSLLSSNVMTFSLKICFLIHSWLYFARVGGTARATTRVGHGEGVGCAHRRGEVPGLPVPAGSPAHASFKPASCFPFLVQKRKPPRQNGS